MDRGNLSRLEQRPGTPREAARAAQPQDSGSAARWPVMARSGSAQDSAEVLELRRELEQLIAERRRMRAENSALVVAAQVQEDRFEGAEAMVTGLKAYVAELEAGAGTSANVRAELERLRTVEEEHERSSAAARESYLRVQQCMLEIDQLERTVAELRASAQGQQRFIRDAEQTKKSAELELDRMRREIEEERSGRLKAEKTVEELYAELGEARNGLADSLKLVAARDKELRTAQDRLAHLRGKIRGGR